MTYEWLLRIQDAEKTAIIENGARKVHYKFTTGEEMAEEYSLETGVLLRRAWKKGDTLSRKAIWEVEVGDPEAGPPGLDAPGIQEQADSPYLVKRVTKTSLEWRIRNVPWPAEVYSVTCDPEARCLVVRTTNKKYFKRIPLPELDRVGLSPRQDDVSFSHKFNTLVITYKKPKEVLDLERQVAEELKTVQTIKDGDLPCKPS